VRLEYVKRTLFGNVECADGIGDEACCPGQTEKRMRDLDLV